MYTHFSKIWIFRKNSSVWFVAFTIDAEMEDVCGHRIAHVLTTIEYLMDTTIDMKYRCMKDGGEAFYFSCPFLTVV